MESLTYAVAVGIDWSWIRGRAGPVTRAGPAFPRGSFLCCYGDYLRSCRTVAGTWLAWASIAVPACDMIWLRVKLTISRDMSVSRTRDSDAVRFSEATDRLATMCSKRFWVAPRVDRAVETLAMAESSRAIAEVAPALVVTSMPDSVTANSPPVEVVSILRFWDTLSWFAPPEPAPTWQARAATVAL